MDEISVCKACKYHADNEVVKSGVFFCIVLNPLQCWNHKTEQLQKEHRKKVASKS